MFGSYLGAPHLSASARHQAHHAGAHAHPI